MKRGTKLTKGRDGKLTKIGQNHPHGTGCLSTLRDGRCCPKPRASKLVPYCKLCMKSGDPSLKAVQHPKFGMILIATRKLPKPYYVAWWGKLTPKKKMARKRMEWALETHKGTIDAVPYKGSLLKFCACSGPSEIPVIDFAPNSHALLKAREKMGAVIFRTSAEIPQNHQVTMMYNMDEKSTEVFFREQGIVRGDVGTAKYPALKKKKKRATVKKTTQKAKRKSKK
eukprot:TRINITY_DN6029_c3_g1_i1.p1 TRINITY_DN6029_c3_g1~~TRINITY_DN6029_c3_g1_i1.p1  ORF type:complete len:226 (+),score=45.85 TRINITY_DN6029_c3_g1_i1:64-741(+)